MKEKHLDTICVQGTYQPKNGEPRVIPICQSTTYKYDSGEHLGKLFDLKEPGHMYTRISNPTVEYVEEHIAALEGGVGAMLVSSGQSANFLTVFNITSAGQNFVSLTSIYGGTINLFSVTMKRMGIECRFVLPGMTDEEIDRLFDDNTRMVFGETLSNPGLSVLDIERFAKIAHKHGVPLVVDNTFPTPVLCRPIRHGADIVVHSTTKYMDGHASVVGGVIVDSGNFDWSAGGKYPEFTTPDESYHGVVYTESFGRAAFITKARVQLLRDFGCIQQPLTAFLLNEGLESLALRMQRHSENALALAAYLERHEKVSFVNYPGLASSPQHALAEKYLPNGASGVIAFGIKGGRNAAMKFMDACRLASIVVHVADARTCVLHPASTTHRQLTDKQLEESGIGADLIRMSVGIENIQDILEDVEQALAAV